METQRLIKRICNLPNNLERAYMNDISNIINNLMEEYDIYYKDTDQKVKSDILIKRFKLDLLDKGEEVLCVGFSKNGNKCTNKTFQDSKYCKRHHYLTFKEQQGIYNSIVVLESKENIGKENTAKENFKTKLIDDTFYYVDDEFIYEKETMNKVGYIEITDENTKNYILTSDPFILGM